KASLLTPRRLLWFPVTCTICNCASTRRSSGTRLSAANSLAPWEHESLYLRLRM
ncbi:unnamed protein product, partial [Amoebophrya sp. A25]